VTYIVPLGIDRGISRPADGITNDARDNDVPSAHIRDGEARALIGTPSTDEGAPRECKAGKACFCYGLLHGCSG
jgi:hypothetical protein